MHVASALAGCQLVEEALKFYLTEALLLAKRCIGNRMPFKMEGKDYSNSALERLIKEFRKLNNNEDLAVSLNAFKDERNFLSHQAITECLDYEREIDEGIASDMEPRLIAIQVEAKRLADALHEETKMISLQLDFDEKLGGR